MVAGAVDPTTPLGDSEEFYRRVLASDVVREEDGSWAGKLSSQAFADREMQPSVDRVLLCDGPARTQREPENAVVGVTRQQIRAEKYYLKDRHNQPIPKPEFAADVCRDPCPEADPENTAHCLIRLNPHPDKSQQKVYKRLIESLARVARPRLPPVGVLVIEAAPE